MKRVELESSLSSLPSDHDATFVCFSKVSAFLAVHHDGFSKDDLLDYWVESCPEESGGRVPVRTIQGGGLGRIHPVKWMPRLMDGWRRLTFVEFCSAYRIPIPA